MKYRKMRRKKLSAIPKRLCAGLLTAVLAFGTVPEAHAAGILNLGRETLTELGGDATVADWKFEQKYTTGAISDATLVICDQSGNDNNLKMQLYKDGQPTTDVNAAQWEDYLKFSDKSMTGSAGSMEFDGDNGKVATAQKKGADFITVDGAAINSETFLSGYTLEFLYYFPKDWTAADQWMSLIARQGTNGGNPEAEQGSMYVSISNCKEVQFITGNAAGNHEMASAAWSVSMDEGGVWYHIAVVSDGKEISTYINGCEAFRDYASTDMAGMFADQGDGRFRIGSSWWKEGQQTLDKFLQGNLQEVRISKAPLAKEEWLIPDPAKYAGEFGSNRAYQLKHSNNYNIVLIPDTQNTVEYCGKEGGVMDTAVKKLIDSADDFNVIGVAGMGDIVDDLDAGQYNTAKRIFYQLPEAGIKTLLQPGNHDGWDGNTGYSAAFGEDSEWGARLANGYLTSYGWSGCMFVEGGGRIYMIMSIATASQSTGWNPNNQELGWFKSMLEKYKDIPTIVTTHDVQNCSDTTPSAIKLSAQGQKLWEIVKGYDQVFMMAGGHSHGSGVEILKNDSNKDVISILTDFQFGYNGGNGWFRYLEFDETDNKIYYSVYSPYAASLDAGRKSFFDVNFLTGEGNEGEIPWNFEERFAGLKKAPAKDLGVEGTEGKWMSGEYHTHTGQSKDATESFLSLDNVLGAAFRNGDILAANKGSATKTDNIVNGRGLDYLMLADHLRQSYNGTDGLGNGKYNVPYYTAAKTQQREIEKLRLNGLYPDKILYSGFEWDMPGLDHASVGIIDGKSPAVPIDGVHQFEWLYASQGSGDDPSSLYMDNGAGEQALYGGRRHNGTVAAAVEGVAWLKDNYPDSFVLPNHPSRHNGGSGVVDINALRQLNDAAPGVVFGFEGMPGNQMDPYCELKPEDIRAGADEMISVTGGVWDALLSEGRRFYNFANSDFHFKISSNQNYSSGYWPSEFSENYTWVEPGSDQRFTFSDVVEGLRSGKSYAVKGSLISDLDFTVSQKSRKAEMGQELAVADGSDVTITIRFRVPEANNYQSLFGKDTGIRANHTPSVDHVDLIMGHVTGKVASSQYSSTENTDAKIIKSFTKAELDAAKGSDGFYTLTYATKADGDMYFRIRGLSSADVDGNGDPVTQERAVESTDKLLRFDQINDYNYSHLSFYGNPVWVKLGEEPQDPKPGETKTVNGSSYKIGIIKGTAKLTEGNKKAASVSVGAISIAGKAYAVTSIGANAFKSAKMKSLGIGANVKSIGKNSFYGCQKLKTVTIGKDVTSIAAGAFAKCSSLKTVKFTGTAIPSIAKNAFKGAKVTKVIVPKKLKKSKAFLKKIKAAGIKVNKLS